MQDQDQQQTIDNYIDPIELSEMDKFVCMEMGRQIHRYIKAMRGSVNMMYRFEDQLKTLSIPEREEAIARYIDLNRKVVSGLDFRMIVARAMANYCDSYDYLDSMLHNERKFESYMKRVYKKYIQFHEVFEENGKFGIRDHKGRILVHPLYDFLRTSYVYVDDLRTMPVIAQRDGRMGLVLPDGKDTVEAPFIYDDISLRDEPPYFEAIKDGKTILLNA
ncbi:MAG: hypothetical protein ACOCOT_07050 [Prevotella sp.]|jgi:hypothetical protein|nr:hypothetical protein [Prevotella sp.]